MIYEEWSGFHVGRLCAIARIYNTRSVQLILSTRLDFISHKLVLIEASGGKFINVKRMNTQGRQSG